MPDDLIETMFENTDDYCDMCGGLPMPDEYYCGVCGGLIQSDGFGHLEIECAGWTC